MTEILPSTNPLPKTSSSSQAQLLHSIDTLLERYLHLLDQYQTHQQELAKHLSAGYLSLAEANFRSPNRIRYGQEFYDERMQASRRVTVLPSPSDRSPKFTIETQKDYSEKAKDNTSAAAVKAASATGEQESKVDDAESASTVKETFRDPLRWFGILVPPALRATQENFSHAALDSIPALASVNEEMRTVEDEIKTKRQEVAKLQ